MFDFVDMIKPPCRLRARHTALETLRKQGRIAPGCVVTGFGKARRERAPDPLRGAGNEETPRSGHHATNPVSGKRRAASTASGSSRRRQSTALGASVTRPVAPMTEDAG